MTSVDNPRDCMNVAVMKAYGDVLGAGALRAMPQPPEPGQRPPGKFWAGWDAWAAALGLRWWYSDKLAPVGLDRWIAGVVCKCDPDEFHAIAMTGERVLFDPNSRPFPGPDSRGVYLTKPEFIWHSVTPTDVVAAMALVPADLEFLRCGHYWHIDTNIERTLSWTSAT